MNKVFLKKFPIILIVFALVLPSIFVFSSILKVEAQTEWLSDFSYRKKITIANTKIDDDLTDFPVLVKLTDSNFDFDKASSTGYDIRFTSSDGETLLSYERERHDTASSTAEYWVKIPTVASSTDTDFYIYYGDSDATDGESATSTWDTNHKGVWHKDDLTTSSIEDSTSNSNDGTKQAANEPNEVDGQIAKAQDYDGTDDYVRSQTVTEVSTVFTASAWIYPYKTADGNNDQNNHGFTILSDDASSRYSFWMRVRQGEVRVNTFTDGTTGVTTSGAGITDNTWHYVVVSAIKGGESKVYVNEVEIHNWTNPGDSGDWSGDFYIGELRANRNIVFDGAIDEVKISDNVRSAAWIKADYNSGNDSLLSFGGAETIKGGMASSNYSITSSDINAGGTENQTSTNYRMSETIGGIATGISTTTLYSLKAGYRQMEDFYITLSSPSDVSLSPSISGMTGNLGSPSSGDVTWNVATDNPAGFSMSVKSSDSPALKLNAANYFSDYEPEASDVPDFQWGSPSSGNAYFGFTVEPATAADTVQSFKDDGANCNAGDNNTSDRCWLNFNGSSDITVINRTGRTDTNGEDEKIKFQAESNEKMLESGSYQTTITVTAVAN